MAWQSRARALAQLVLLLGCASVACAQAWPTRPVRNIVPRPPGDDIAALLDRVAILPAPTAGVPTVR